jgi:hypothetical protein
MQKVPGAEHHDARLVGPTAWSAPCRREVNPRGRTFAGCYLQRGSASICIWRKSSMKSKSSLTMS